MATAPDYSVLWHPAIWMSAWTLYSNTLNSCKTHVGFYSFPRLEETGS